MWRTLVRFHEKFWASKVFRIFVKNFRSSRSANSAFLLLKIISTRRRLCQEVHKVFNRLQMFSRALNRNKSSQRKTYLPEVITNYKVKYSECVVTRIRGEKHFFWSFAISTWTANNKGIGLDQILSLKTNSKS